MPGHGRQSVSFGAVLAGPFVNFDGAFYVDPRPLHQLVGGLDRLHIEDHDADPLSVFVITDAHIDAQIRFAGL